MEQLMLLTILVSFLALSSSRCNGEEPIHDTDGQELRHDAGYYILPADGRDHLVGGLALDPMDGDNQCPQRVRIADNDQFEGFPVLIAPWNASGGAAGALRLSADVGIRFDSARTSCGAKPEWHLHMMNRDMRWHVAAGDRDRLHPPSTAAFRIERHGSAPEGYKLVSCAGWPNDGRRCHDLGMYVGLHGQKKWLVVSDDKPFVVAFKKFTGQPARRA
ncbi:hypothetical protein ACP70R_026586 [Stipagrostis hirtigluma subsp. patula]